MNSTCYRAICAAMMLAPLSAGAQIVGEPRATEGSQSIARLGVGETLVQISAKGISYSPADTATLIVPINCEGDTPLAARTAFNTSITRLTKFVVARGLKTTDLEVIDLPSSALGFVGNEAYDGRDFAPQLAMTVPTTRRSFARGSVRIRIADTSRLSRLRDDLEQNDVAVSGSVLELKDDRTARRSAIASALATARTDADAYAAALRMRVVRIDAVVDQTARSSVEELGIALSQFTGGGRSGQVQTDVRLTVNFVLAAL